MGRTRNVREILREETKQEHQFLESSSRLMSADFSLQEYAQLIQRWGAFYLAFDQYLTENQLEYPEVFAFMQGRRKSHWLQEDLRHLGGSISSIDFQKAQDFLKTQFLPESHLWGMLYVLEGSSLGAQMIVRHLRKKFGPEAPPAFEFYQGYGDETGPMWRDFLSELEGNQFEDFEIEECLESARKTFRFLASYL